MGFATVLPRGPPRMDVRPRGSAKKPASASGKAPPSPPEASCHSGLLHGTRRWGEIWAGDQTHCWGPLGRRACIGQLALKRAPLNLGWGPCGLQPSGLRLGPPPPSRQMWASVSGRLLLPAGGIFSWLSLHLHAQTLSLLMYVSGGGQAVSDEPSIIVDG